MRRINRKIGRHDLIKGHILWANDIDEDVFQDLLYHKVDVVLDEFRMLTGDEIVDTYIYDFDQYEGSMIVDVTGRNTGTISFEFGYYKDGSPYNRRGDMLYEFYPDRIIRDMVRGKLEHKHIIY